MIYEENTFKDIPINVLGVSDEVKFLKPLQVEIDSITVERVSADQQDETTRIRLKYPRYSGPTKTIFEFGHVAQNVPVELNIDYSESDRQGVMLQNAIGSVVQYHPSCPETVEVLYKTDRRVYLHAVGVARISGLELWVSRRDTLFKLVKVLQKFKQYATKAQQYIKTNGVDQQLLKKAYQKTRAILHPPKMLADPFEQVFGYSKRWTSQSPINTVALGCSSLGNFFMQEISDLVASGLREAGVSVQQFDQRNLPNTQAFDAVIIVAPHEFFTLDCAKSAFKHLRRTPRLYMLNTEQPQTAWFAAALGYLKSADKILDMNYQTALRLSANGLPARFLPLGYSESYYQKFTPTPLSKTGPMAGLPEAIVSYPAEAYSARPIDILFVGTESPRRKEFFARNAAYFSDKECFIYMPPGSDPFTPGSPATIGFQDLLGLARRSKVILNIHRDADQYLEWQRIVNIGVFSDAIVVSETCDSNPVLKPAYHYIDTPLDAMLDNVEQILSNPEFFVNTLEKGRSHLAASASMSRTLNLLFSESSCN